MKHNLKNFPVKGTPQAYERWGKGFQKELQERIKHWENLIQPNDCYHKLYCVNFAKEILGE